MGLFDEKNNNDSKVVWRNIVGNIVCPGDSCPKDCDNSCPIFLNTQAAMMISIGQSTQAIPIYEEALAIAPDFYDAWNNLGGIYGQKGDYQKAYECYIKARELNKEKPNPVYGLMLTSRDLEKYDECLKWCDVYQNIASDGRDITIRDEVNKKLGNRTGGCKTERFYREAKAVLDDHGLEYPEVNKLFDVKKLCEDIVSFCKKCYLGSKKLTEEYFISAYYDALCLTIHYIQDENAFTRENAYQFLQSKCDTEYCDIYSDRLLGYMEGDPNSDNIWEIFRPYLRAVLMAANEFEKLSEDILYAMMKPAIAIGIAVAYEYYEPTQTHKSEYVGKHVDIETLVGRNYYHVINGSVAKTQPFVLDINDIVLDEDDDDAAEEKHDFLKSGLSAYVAKDCWIKKKSASENDTEANRLIVIELDKDSNIVNVSEVVEKISHVGGGMFMIPGMEMPSKKEYLIQVNLSDEAVEEIELLLNKRIIPNGFSFIGKRLPQAMLDEDSDNSGSYALQSAYRSAYMDVNINTDAEGIIESFDYSTYQSTGSGYWDMFTRPQCISDKHEEMIDMLLYIIDLYSDDEYKSMMNDASFCEANVELLNSKK